MDGAMAASADGSEFRISGLLPVGPGVGLEQLGEAVGSLVGQTVVPVEILVVGNGLGGAEWGALEGRFAGWSRGREGWPEVRLIRLERANLAAALNRGLREARSGLVARMDADDWSFPERLERQAARFQDEPRLAGVGCAWEVVGPGGMKRAVMRPAIEPGRLAWSLLLGNTLAHGSMLLRRDAILAIGGYDESLERAQDYDLWLRLGRAGLGLAAMPEVLYRYQERGEQGVGATSESQARASVGAMLGGWGALAGASGNELGRLSEAMTRAMLTQDGGGVVAELESMLDGGATREGLAGVLWARDRFPALPRRAMDACRGSRVREVTGQMRASGAREAWLWGAGQHTAWMLQHAESLMVPVAGIVDDALVGANRLGHVVRHPDELRAGEHVLLSSDWHEGAMWASSAGHRARGVKVWRLYEGGAD